MQCSSQWAEQGKSKQQQKQQSTKKQINLLDYSFFFSCVFFWGFAVLVYLLVKNGGFGHPLSKSSLAWAQEEAKAQAVATGSPAGHPKSIGIHWKFLVGWWLNGEYLWFYETINPAPNIWVSLATSCNNGAVTLKNYGWLMIRYD
jgi:hypothetical protein